MRQTIRQPLVRYGMAAATVALAMLFKTITDFVFGGGPPLILFLSAVMVTAGFAGPGPGLAATALTGVWNRGTIIEILQRELARAAREGTSVGVIMADLDHFKRINDTLGHLAGDIALREVSRRMGIMLRPYDAIGRYGGEEFLVVLPGCDLPGALGVAERMRQAIAEMPVAVPTGTTRITVSLGAAAGEGPSLDADGLIRKADETLYRAKRGGRNRVESAMKSETYAPSDS